jgi:hypothetical protein
LVRSQRYYLGSEHLDGASVERGAPREAADARLLVNIEYFP